MPGSSVIFNHVLFFGRRYDEVMTLFNLKEEDLKDRRVLDCNSGPDAFVGEANRRGYTVTGCDPLYAKTLTQLREEGLKDIEYSLKNSRNRRDTTGELDVEEYNRLKKEALEIFLKDFEQGLGKGWHVPGALPSLPFENGSFDLALSAHFLFIASHPRFGGMIDTEDFDLDFHRKAIRELLRVSRRELRLFPINRIGSRKDIHPWAAIIMGELAAEGFGISIELNTYDQGQYTGPHVLVIRKPEK